MPRSLILICISLSLLLISLRCARQEDRGESETEIVQSSSAFMGSENCMSCHSEEYKSWSGSHHDWAMKPANAETVFGDFDMAQIQLDGINYKFYQEGGDFLVEVDEPDSEAVVYKVAFTFGVEPLQQYLIEFSGGKMQALRATWDTEKKLWFHQYPGEAIPKHDWLHWTQGGQNWNTMCADCHSTNLQTNYDWRVDTFHTTWSEVNVACEACHGAGDAHIKWAGGDTSEDDPYILGLHEQLDQINSCGPCHARRTKLVDQYNPALAFHEQFELQTLHPDFYHPDGQIREEDYVLGSFLSSQMFLEGVMCTDCHDPHTNELKFIGNELCMQCHEPEYDSEAHHFHSIGTEGAECVNCHMTGQTYMGNDFRRDHSFRIPRPDQSVAYGTPNACTDCHTGQSDQWAADQVVAWYGPERPSHFSDALLLSLKDSLTAQEAAQVQLLIGLNEFPYIARATAIENYSFMHHGKDYEVLLGAQNDPNPLVRSKALQKYQNEMPGQRAVMAFKFFNDESKLVRLEAVALAADANLNEMSEEWYYAFREALPEYRKYLYVNSNFATGRAQLGDYFFKRGILDSAILHYEMALEMDDQLGPVYGNLAAVYNSVGQDELAISILNDWIIAQPWNARANYLRGLILYETDYIDLAEDNFQKAIEKDPEFYRAYYNLATLMYHQKRYDEANEVIKKGLEINPNDPDGLNLLMLTEKI